MDFTVVHEESLAPALTRLEEEEITLILCDLNLPDSAGLDTFRSVQAKASRIPIVILSNEGDQEQAVTAVREGAEDCLVKPCCDIELLVRCIRFAVERSRRLHAEAQVQAAADVQHMLFPDSESKLPGFDITAESFPALEAGGDYFDFIPTRGDSMMVVVGDVSGHGLGPAMLAAESRAMTRTAAPVRKLPHKTLEAGVAVE